MTLLSFLFFIEAPGCRNVLNKSKEAEFVDIPYTITRGLADSCSTLYFATQQDQYKLVDCVLKIGFNDKYLIVSSYKDTSKVIGYWIINKSIKEIEKIKKTENVEGPLDFDKFNERKKILKIDTVEFTKEIK